MADDGSQDSDETDTLSEVMLRWNEVKGSDKSEEKKEEKEKEDLPKTHSLHIRSDDVPLDLKQGENWLTLSTFDLTQSSTTSTASWEPSIASLADLGRVSNTPTQSFICFEVDQEVLMVKDYRFPQEISEDPIRQHAVIVIATLLQEHILARRQFQVLRPGATIRLQDAQGVVRLELAYMYQTTVQIDDEEESVSQLPVSQLSWNSSVPNEWLSTRRSQDHEPGPPGNAPIATTVKGRSSSVSTKDKRTSGVSEQQGGETPNSTAAADVIAQPVPFATQLSGKRASDVSEQQGGETPNSSAAAGGVNTQSFGFTTQETGKRASGVSEEKEEAPNSTAVGDVTTQPVPFATQLSGKRASDVSEPREETPKSTAAGGVNTQSFGFTTQETGKRASDVSEQQGETPNSSAAAAGGVNTQSFGFTTQETGKRASDVSEEKEEAPNSTAVGGVNTQSFGFTTQETGKRASDVSEQQGETPNSSAAAAGGVNTQSFGFTTQETGKRASDVSEEKEEAPNSTAVGGVNTQSFGFTTQETGKRASGVSTQGEAPNSNAGDANVQLVPFMTQETCKRASDVSGEPKEGVPPVIPQNSQADGKLSSQSHADPQELKENSQSNLSQQDTCKRECNASEDVRETKTRGLTENSQSAGLAPQDGNISKEPPKEEETNDLLEPPVDDSPEVDDNIEVERSSVSDEVAGLQGSMELSGDSSNVQDEEVSDNKSAEDDEASQTEPENNATIVRRRCTRKTTPVVSKVPPKSSRPTRLTKKQSTPRQAPESSARKRGVETSTPTPSKRTRKASTPVTSKSTRKGKAQSIVCIASTGVQLSAADKTAISNMGGCYVDSMTEIFTHLIASDGKESIKRTAKLLVGLCTTPNIVTSKWLKDSIKKGSFVSVDKKYLILKDKKAEKQYGFEMRKSLERLESRQGKLLEGWSVYLAPGVAGKGAPSKEEFQRIVDATGATWLTSQKGLTTNELVLILTGVSSQSESASVTRARKQGAVVKSFKEFFDCIMQQEIGWL